MSEVNQIYKTFTASEVKVSLIAATRNAYSNKVITTLLCEYPRYIHSEIMTHRQLSRNSGSSRATPFNIYCERITKDPVLFAELGINNSGMNADNTLSKECAEAFKQEYTQTMYHNVGTAAAINTYANKVVTTVRCEHPNYVQSDTLNHQHSSSSDSNSSTSKVTPFDAYCERITKNPAFFAELGINRSGMNADNVLSKENAEAFKQEYMQLMHHIVDTAKTWSSKYNLHKQIINRVLEPYVRTSTVITATEWDNFLYTRAIAKGVEPVMHLLANCIKQAVEYANENAKEGVVHLPFVTADELSTQSLKDCVKHAVSRSARCTILSNVTKKLSTIEEDEKLYSWLSNADPMHASPFEHIAFATKSYEPYYNLRGGWMSQRFVLDTERLIQSTIDRAAAHFAA